MASVMHQVTAMPQQFAQQAAAFEEQSRQLKEEAAAARAEVAEAKRLSDAAGANEGAADESGNRIFPCSAPVSHRPGRIDKGNYCPDPNVRSVANKNRANQANDGSARPGQAAEFQRQWIRIPSMEPQGGTLHVFKHAGSARSFGSCAGIIRQCKRCCFAGGPRAPKCSRHPRGG